MSKWNCPNCGEHKKPWFRVCYNCHNNVNKTGVLIFLFIMISILFGFSWYQNNKEAIIYWILFTGKIILILFVAYILYWVLFKKK